eukprot:6369400-Pyramimonas_sp.AAC.1
MSVAKKPAAAPSNTKESATLGPIKLGAFTKASYITQFRETTGKWHSILNIEGSWMDRQGANFEDHRTLAAKIFEHAATSNCSAETLVSLRNQWVLEFAEGKKAPKRKPACAQAAETSVDTEGDDGEEEDDDKEEHSSSEAEHKPEDPFADDDFFG